MALCPVHYSENDLGYGLSMEELDQLSVIQNHHYHVYGPNKSGKMIELFIVCQNCSAYPFSEKNQQIMGSLCSDQECLYRDYSYTISYDSNFVYSTWESERESSHSRKRTYSVAFG